MDNAIITQELVAKVLSLIEESTSLKKESISFEIQDDFQQLLISISIDNFHDIEPASVFIQVGQLLNTMMPTRRGDYSWMVVFTKSGKIVDSYFGGNLDSPDSGLYKGTPVKV